MTRLLQIPACIAVLMLISSACSAQTPQQPSDPHELVAAEPGDEVSFDASDQEGLYARVTVRRGEEEAGNGGMPGARYVAVHIRYEIVASREDMIVGQNNWYLFQPSLDRKFHQLSSGVIEFEPELPALQMPFSQGEVIEGWLMVEVTEDRLDSDVYMAFADAGPFSPDLCCSASPPQSVADTDALILFRVSGAG